MQLSYGLSSEYSKSPAAEKTDSEKVDADRQLYAKYYVSQIMQMGEEGIRDAWNKAIARPISWLWTTPWASYACSKPQRSQEVAVFWNGANSSSLPAVPLTPGAEQAC